MGKLEFLKSYPLEYDNNSDDNHIYIHTVASNRDYTLAVNVASNQESSKLFYCVKSFELIEKNTKASGKGLSRKAVGWGEDEQEGLIPNASFDYFADGWATQDEICIEEKVVSPTNELSKLLIEQLQKTIAEPAAFLITYGMTWYYPDRADWTFGFQPARGMHDIHCNQCSPAGSEWRQHDKPGQDGVIFFCYPEENTAVGFFMMFK